jgi:AmmeMemoRadiSam system protein B
MFLKESLKKNKIFISLLIALFFSISLGYFYNRTKIVSDRYDTFRDDFFVEESLKRLKQIPQKIEGVKGLIVNHHLLASHLITEAFLVLDKEPKSIIILSPNHFYAGNNIVQVADVEWNTPYGTVCGDDKRIKILGESELVGIENISFRKEHGIFNIIPFIKKFFPNAKIVPVIIKDSLTREEADIFILTLEKVIDNNTVLVGSFDFSHEASPQITEKRDKISLSVLDNLLIDEIYDSVHVDSRPGLYIISKLFKSKNLDFNVLNNTNSSVLIDNKNQTDTTSYITGYFK